MTTEQIQEKITSILQLMGLEVVPSFDAKLNSFIDSLEVVELCYEVEKHFNIVLTNDEIESLQTLESLVDLVYSKIDATILPR